MTTGQILEMGAEAVPDKTAIVDGEQRKTYRELNEMTDALAAGFSEVGFRKGDRVGIYMKSSLEFVIAFYALQKIGVIIAWVNPMYRKTEAQFILGNSEAKGVVICSEWGGYDYLDAIQSAKKDLPNLESIILVGEGDGEGVYSFSDLLEQGKDKSFTPPAIDPHEDLSMLLYTSGTTGKPKGAMICHQAAVRGAYEYGRGIEASAEDIFIVVLPMSHSYGCGALLIQPLLLQATAVLVDRFEPEGAFQLIEKEKVTLQLAAPAHYILELGHEKRNNYDLSSLRAGLIAGQIPPEGLISRVEKEMGVYLTSFWGASEVGPGLSIMCPPHSSLEIREKTIGRPIPGMEVRVVDPVSRQEVPDGERGELTIRGWAMMKGYWKNPEETQKQIIDGWLFMGDIISKEEDGFLRIYGRTKDLINRGGYKIYPSELEAEILDHPDIEQVCVVATPNPVLGENICACVIPTKGETVTLDGVKAFLKDKIAPHKMPSELCIMEDFPRLSGGIKINKFGKGGLAEIAENDKTREGYRE
ncbi:MAG: AMP-binding protein [Deltaproteobacteria bacterium]|nr:AMP-binding protein [Deltaproteobacteria bacterium]